MHHSPRITSSRHNSVSPTGSVTGVSLGAKRAVVWALVVLLSEVVVEQGDAGGHEQHHVCDRGLERDREEINEQQAGAEREHDEAPFQPRFLTGRSAMHSKRTGHL